MAEHEYRPDAQRAARGEEHDAEPAHGISIDRPEFDPVGIGRQIGHQQPDHPERREHPAVAAILALAGAEISAAEQRDDAEDDEHDGERAQRRVREEGCKGPPTEDGEGEISKARKDGDGG